MHQHQRLGQQRKPPHTIKAGRLIFKFEIIRAGLEGGNHSHVPRKPHPAGSGRGERREALTNSLISARQTVPSPRCHSHRLQDVSTGKLHGFFFSCEVLRGEREGKEKTQPSLECRSAGCSPMGSQSSQQDAVVHYQQGTTFHGH